MHGLAILYLGYFIYLTIYFRYDAPTKLAKKITLFLGIKLLVLTAVYFAFFHHKMSKYERQQQLDKLIIN